MYVYHGTSQANAMAITDGGFREGTWFTPYLDSALCFGGEYVFACWVEDKDYPGLGTDDNWQFQITEPWPVDRIVSLVHYSAELLYADPDFNVQNKMQGQPCPVCHGSGEIFRNFNERQARHWLPRTHYVHQMSLKHFSVCDNCHGYGSLARLKKMRGADNA